MLWAKLSRLYGLPLSSYDLLGIGSLISFITRVSSSSTNASRRAQSLPKLTSSESFARYDEPRATTSTASRRLVLPLAFGPTTIFTDGLNSKVSSVYDLKFCNRRLAIMGLHQLKTHHPHK